MLAVQVVRVQDLLVLNFQAGARLFLHRVVPFGYLACSERC